MLLFSSLRRLLRPRHQKYYGHIISLGYNCEVSFQFFLKYHFVESSLFAWANCIDLAHLTAALSNIETIAAGGLKNTNPMWRCQNTGICFHGKAPVSVWRENPSDNVITADREELFSRLNHLKQKFRQTAADGKKNLYIYKLAPSDILDTALADKLRLLFATLQSLCHNPFDLLLILEQGKQPDLEKKLQDPGFFIRRVAFFTDENNVTAKCNDHIHWRKIFDEFRPDFRLKKTKKFKFEEL